MTDQTHSEPLRLSLPVASPPDRVEQLRAEATEDPASGQPSLAAIAHANRPPRTDIPPELQDLERRIVEELRNVYDPEIPVNVYDLGLIYAIDISPEKSVKVKMTLTAPGCPVAGIIVSDVENRIRAIPDVKDCMVELVWDPPWSREMISEAARLDLGL